MLKLMVLTGKPGAAPPLDEEFISAVGPALDVPDRYRFNFSYVVDRTTMLPVEPILRYLTFSASTSSNAEVTIKNKADNCYELFLYLDAIGVEYRDVCLDNLIEYKERLSAYVSPKTHRPLKEGTIKGRLQVAREFCTFHGILPPEETVKVRGKAVAGHKHTKLVGQSAALTVETTTQLVEYVSVEDLKRLLASLGEAPGSEGGRSSRDWLLAVFCVTTGVRLSEALGLTVYQILDVAYGRRDSETAFITLSKTKGSKPRTIRVDWGVIDLLVKYIDGERKEAIAKGLASKPKKRETSSLFVNGPSCAPKFSGERYKAKRAEERFAASQIEIGMTRTVPIYDLDTREPSNVRVISKHVIHHLRHTYAIMAWNAYRHLHETERWIRIQLQLGHKSYEITANTYMRAVKHLEAGARDILGNYYTVLTNPSLPMQGE